MPPASLRLSKSRVMAGLQCHKRLWWTVHEPNEPELEPDDALQALFDDGTRVGEAARTYVPGAGDRAAGDTRGLGASFRRGHWATVEAGPVLS